MATKGIIMELDFNDFTFSTDLIPAVLCLMAGILYLTHYSGFHKEEKLIVWVIWLNIFADLVSYFVMHIPDQSNAFVYNGMTPIEKIITLIAYGQNTFGAKRSSIYSWAILIVVLLTAYDMIFVNGLFIFNALGFVSSGIFVAFLSYLHLRDILNGKAGDSRVFTIFCSANFVYYTLMVSSFSAYQLANIVAGNDFASKVLIGNLIAYAIWSIILIAGLLWTRKN